MRYLCSSEPLESSLRDIQQQIEDSIGTLNGLLVASAGESKLSSLFGVRLIGSIKCHLINVSGVRLHSGIGSIEDKPHLLRCARGCIPQNLGARRRRSGLSELERQE